MTVPKRMQATNFTGILTTVLTDDCIRVEYAYDDPNRDRIVIAIFLNEDEALKED